MATVERFEDLEIWKKARELCKLIHTYTEHDKFSRDFRLVGQIKGSSGSVMDNFAEGFERGGNKEFSQFIWISKGSCGETRSQLYRALDNGYINQSEFEAAYNLTVEISKMSKNFSNYLKSSEIKGTKFKKE